jgi:hypothetical protein
LSAGFLPPVALNIARWYEVENASQRCVSELTMRVVSWCSAFPEALLLLKENVE